MRKLLSAIEYWDKIYPIDKSDSWITEWYDNYIQFLKQHLQLGFFVPCDNEGKPFEKPKHYDEWKSEYDKGFIHEYDIMVMKEYQQACDRCLFTGFELYQDTYFNNYNCVIRGSDMVIINIENKTIEDIAPLKVEVTDRIAKQFKLK